MDLTDLTGSLLAAVTDDSVQQIRKTAEIPPRVSVYDVLGLIYGFTSNNSSNVLQRLVEQFPEVARICSNFRFQGRGQRDTPVADAEGIITIILLLPGRTATRARQSAANVMVRYLGGDQSLVQEVMHNHNIQVELEPDHPAAIFGQSVPPSGPTPYELGMARNARMQELATAFTCAQAINSTSLPRVRDALQKAIDDTLLPAGTTTEQYVDAAAILKERAYTEEQIDRLASEFGRDLKLVRETEGRASQSNEQEFGPESKQIGLYHRTHDANLIEDVLASFKERPLYKRVMAGVAAPISRRRRLALLNAEGRGRGGANSSSVH